MSQQQKKLKGRQKKKLRRIFFKTIAATFIILGVAVGAFAFVYHNYLYDGSGTTLFEPKKNDPINKTLAVFGVDEDGYRTDVIFVVNYNSESGNMRVISIPRDTLVEWTDEQQNLSELRKGYRVSSSKINEMTSYGGIENIRDLTIAQIEDILDIQVDNYVIITTDAFRKIVDAVGGVEVEVPALDGNGLQYDDNYQNLHIHLSPGLQHLDGEQAEGLVRFRKGYADGDVGRIKTQQAFLQAFTKKVTSPSIITKVPGIISAVLETVTTDVKLSEISGYMPYLKSLSADQLVCDVVPGEPQYIRSKSYYVIDEEKVPSFMQELFSSQTAEGEDGEESTVDKSVSIQVLNSTGVSGLAGRAKEKLESNGYTVSEIGNYTNGVLGYTIIYARDEKLGKQFLDYYPDAKVVQDSSIDYDICIALGNDAS